jgi:autotransporter-associated beta strand protein
MKYTKFAITITATIAILIGAQSFTQCRGDEGGTLTIDAGSPICLTGVSGASNGTLLIMNAIPPICPPINIGISGTATINAGSLALSNNDLGNGYNTTMGGAVAVTETTRTVFQPGIFSGATLDVSGASDLVKSSAGTLVLNNGSNTYTGSTTISAGTLQLGNAGLGPVAISGTMQISNTSAGTGLLNNTSSGTLRIPTIVVNDSLSPNVTVIGGSGTINAAGTLKFNGSGAITGITITNPGASYKTPPFFSTSATITVGGFGALINSGAGSVTLNGSSTSAFTVINGGTLQINNPSLGATQIGTGNITLSGSSAGATIINIGILQPSISTSGTMNIFPLQPPTATITAAPITVNQSSTSTLVVNNSNFTLSGAILAPNITNSASGILTLSPSNTYSGLTNTSGTLLSGIGGSGNLTIGSGTLTINPGTGTLQYGNINSSGSLTLASGAGTLQASSINLNTLTIGAGSTLTIAALPGGPVTSASLAPVESAESAPEPSVMVLLSIAVLAFISFRLRSK